MSALIVGVLSFLFGWLIVRSGALPRGLGYVGIFNAILLVVLYFASAEGQTGLILISVGLTSVIVGPIWWIWSGLSLWQGKPEETPQIATNAVRPGSRR